VILGAEIVARHVARSAPRNAAQTAEKNANTAMFIVAGAAKTQVAATR